MFCRAVCLKKFLHELNKFKWSFGRTIVVGGQSKVAALGKVQNIESSWNIVIVTILFLKAGLLILLQDCSWHENKVFFNTFDLCCELLNDCCPFWNGKLANTGQSQWVQLTGSLTPLLRCCAVDYSIIKDPDNLLITEKCDPTCLLCTTTHQENIRLGNLISWRLETWWK